MKRRDQRRINRANKKQTRYDNRTPGRSFWSSCPIVLAAISWAVFGLIAVAARMFR